MRKIFKLLHIQLHKKEVHIRFSTSGGGGHLNEVLRTSKCLELISNCQCDILYHRINANRFGVKLARRLGRRDIPPYRRLKSGAQRGYFVVTHLRPNPLIPCRGFCSRIAISTTHPGQPQDSASTDSQDLQTLTFDPSLPVPAPPPPPLPRGRSGPDVGTLGARLTRTDVCVRARDRRQCVGCYPPRSARMARPRTRLYHPAPMSVLM